MIGPATMAAAGVVCVFLSGCAAEAGRRAVSYTLAAIGGFIIGAGVLA